MSAKRTIYMIHKGINSLSDLCGYLSIPYDKYDLEWDQNSPDYLFVSEHIYLYKSSWDEFEALYPKSRIRVFHAGECISPDFNIFDYAICFDFFL